jgi:predicted transcriptional regulator
VGGRDAVVERLAAEAAAELSPVGAAVAQEDHLDLMLGPGAEVQVGEVGAQARQAVVVLEAKAAGENLARARVAGLRLWPGLAGAPSLRSGALYNASMSSIKEEVHKLADQLADGATWDEVMYEIYVRQKIAAGEAAIADGRTVAHEEVKKRFASA